MIFSFHQENSKTFSLRSHLHTYWNEAVWKSFLCWISYSTFLFICTVDTMLRTSTARKPLESFEQTTIHLENVFIVDCRIFPVTIREHCLVWICLDDVFWTASIMHLCTISIDRYLSLRYSKRLSRNTSCSENFLCLISMSLLLSFKVKQCCLCQKLFVSNLN
jgi:hypothetical protein